MVAVSIDILLLKSHAISLFLILISKHLKGLNVGVGSLFFQKPPSGRIDGYYSKASVASAGLLYIALLDKIVGDDNPK